MNVKKLEDYKLRFERVADWYKKNADDKPLKHSTINAKTDSERFANHILHHVEQLPLYMGDGETKEKSSTKVKKECADVIKHAKALAKSLACLPDNVRFNLSISNENETPAFDPLDYVNFIIDAAEVEIGEINGKPSEQILSVKPDHNPSKQTKYNRQIGTFYHEVIKFYKIPNINKTNMASLLRAIYGSLEDPWGYSPDVKKDAYYIAVTGSDLFEVEEKD